MEHEPAWRCLHECGDFSEALMVRTTIAAMEFDVRLLDRAGVDVLHLEDESRHTPPYRVDVRAEDWADLVDVLPDLIDEQKQFDAMLDSRDHMVGRAHRWLVIALITLVAVLATLGYIEL